MTTDENSRDDTMFDMNKKKKSKKRINRDVLLETTTATDSIENIVGDGTTNDAIAEENDFTYQFMLQRAFDMIRKTKSLIGPEDPKHTCIVPVPRVARIGRIRTSFLNFGEICRYLKRQEKTLYEYFLTETGAKASIDGSHALVIRGRYGQRDIESILRKFIKEYVICKACHSPDTSLGKSDRLTVIKCTSCHSQYSVSSIKTGFQAQVGKRARENK